MVDALRSGRSSLKGVGVRLSPTAPEIYLPIIDSMDSFEKHFNGKKITLMGLGLLGRGVGDAKFLAELGADLTVTDLKRKEDLEGSIEKLKDFDNVRFVLGEHRIEDFSKADMIIKGAGVPLDSVYIDEAHKKGVPVCMSSALFAELTPATVIGVTGTKGKTTVSCLLEHILKKAGKKVFLGGNAKPISTLAHLPKSTEDEIAVLELDSWQLQGFGEVGISPSIAVFTSFMPDHLNYYKGNMDSYFRDKSYIFSNQKKGEILFVGKQAYGQINDRYSKSIRSKVIVAQPEKLLFDPGTVLLGNHNAHNIALACSTAVALGVSAERFEEYLSDFIGISGRMESLGSYEGRVVYNDNNATTPDATISSIDTLKNNGELILIIGGSDKNLSVDKLAKKINDDVSHVILLPGSGSDKLRSFLRKDKVTEVSDLKEAIGLSKKISKTNDIILFSPAFASFSSFRNEYEREKVFLEELKKVFI